MFSGQLTTPDRFSYHTGYMYLLTTSPSKTRDSTLGTTEIGLKSPGPVGVFVLATGRMRATRHCSGMVVENEKDVVFIAKSCVWRCSCLEDRFQILGVCGCRGVERVHVLDRKWQISFR